MHQFKQTTLCWRRVQQFGCSAKIFTKGKKHLSHRRSHKIIKLSSFMLVIKCCSLYPPQILPRGEAISNQVPFRDFAIKNKATVELCWRSTFQEAAKVSHYWNHVVVSFVKRNYLNMIFNSNEKWTFFTQVQPFDNYSKHIWSKLT